MFGRSVGRTLCWTSGRPVSVGIWPHSARTLSISAEFWATRGQLWPMSVIVGNNHSLATRLDRLRQCWARLRPHSPALRPNIGNSARSWPQFGKAGLRFDYLHGPRSGRTIEQSGVNDKKRGVRAHDMVSNVRQEPSVTFIFPRDRGRMPRPNRQPRCVCMRLPTTPAVVAVSRRSAATVLYRALRRGRINGSTVASAQRHISRIRVAAPARSSAASRQDFVRGVCRRQLGPDRAALCQRHPIRCEPRPPPTSVPAHHCKQRVPHRGAPQPRRHVSAIPQPSAIMAAARRGALALNRPWMQQHRRVGE